MDQREHLAWVDTVLRFPFLDWELGAERPRFQDLVGTRRADSYQLETIDDGTTLRGFLGKGGCGAVFRARRLDTARARVALKTFAPWQAPDFGRLAELGGVSSGDFSLEGLDAGEIQARRQRFLELLARRRQWFISQLNRDFITRLRREANALARVSSDFTVCVHHVGSIRLKPDRRVPKLLYLVMDEVPGKTLDRVAPQFQGNVDRISRLGYQLARGLAAIHDEDITHRDIKESNTILRRTPGGSWSAVLIDFGMARSAGDTPITQPAFADDYEYTGTRHYMPFEDTQVVPDSARDQFGLGVTLYHLFTGEFPYRDKRSKHPQTGRDPLSLTARPAAGAGAASHPWLNELNRIVLRLIHRDRSLRFRTTRDVVAAFQQLIKPDRNRPPVEADSATVSVLRDGVLKALIAEITLLQDELTRPDTTTPPSARMWTEVEGRLVDITARINDACPQGAAGALRTLCQKIGDCYSRFLDLGRAKVPAADNWQVISPEIKKLKQDLADADLKLAIWQIPVDPSRGPS